MTNPSAAEGRGAPTLRDRLMELRSNVRLALADAIDARDAHLQGQYRQWSDDIDAMLARAAEPSPPPPSLLAIAALVNDYANGDHPLSAEATIRAIRDALGPAMASVAAPLETPRQDWRKTADELIEEVRRSEIISAEDLAIRVRSEAPETPPRDYSAERMERLRLRCEKHEAEGRETDDTDWLFMKLRAALQGRPSLNLKDARVVHSSEIADDPAAFSGDYVPLEDVQKLVEGRSSQEPRS